MDNNNEKTLEELSLDEYKAVCELFGGRKENIKELVTNGLIRH